MGIGFCGAHRTGKTTLATEVATACALPLVRTSTSAVFQRLGLDPAAPLTAEQRLVIQRLVLDGAIAQWAPLENRRFVSDRTPLDMAAYLLADIQGATVVDATAVTDYVAAALAATQHYFQHLFLIPPAIPLVWETGKAALNRAYMLHLHYLVGGLCGTLLHSAQDGHPRQHQIHFLPQELTDLTQRRIWVTRRLF
jgi:hypothetical protein